jgi:opacity protein-like surface antigen
VSGFNDTGAGAATGGYGYAPSKNTTSLAWAAQAGISYNVTPRFKVDVGYRYLDMGSAKTGAVTCLNDGCAVPTSYKIKDITSHDVKIGVRYLLGGVAEIPLPPLAPAYEPGPIVRKY